MRDFVIGMIAGAVVGAGVTLLTTPKRGDEMRKLVKDETLDIKNKLDIEMAKLKNKDEKEKDF